MTQISTSYLGLELPSPVVASASPLWENISNIQKAEEAGAGAVVLHSLFEEQITSESKELDRFLVQGTESFAESLSYFPDLKEYRLGPDEYLEHVSNAKDAVGIPIIASLNGVSNGGWIRYAKEMEEAGADAVELNVYYIPTRPGLTSKEVEDMYVELATGVKGSVDIPVAVKIGPYFSSLPNIVMRMDRGGLDALVIFNRFYQPDLDVDGLRVIPNLELSTSQELRLRIRWAAILFGKIQAEIAVTGGVHTARDVVKSIMAGANVAMTTSALIKNGVKHVKTLNQGLRAWMKKHGYSSLNEMVGTLSQESVPDPAAFERANYMKIIGLSGSKRSHAAG